MQPARFVGGAIDSVWNSKFQWMIEQYPLNAITLAVIDSGGPRIMMNLAVMPERMEALHRYLVQVTPTASGMWVDDFGRAPGTVTLEGTFGRKMRIVNGDPMTGFAQTKYLQHLAEESHRPENPNALDLRDYPKTYLLAWNLDEFWEVTINEVNVSQSVNRNMLWVYRLRMTALRPIGFDELLKDEVKEMVGGVVVAKAANYALERATELLDDIFGTNPAGPGDKLFYR